MPRSARVKSMSGVYHIMWRGANRQEIFHDDEDCNRFLDILAKYKRESELEIYAWCLMGNHVHLLLREGKEDISNTMKRIGVSYASYYNWKYDTTGHLFQGRFKSENVEDNRYLLTVTRYIHQNPVKAGIVDRPNEWKWSSCREYYAFKPHDKRNLLDANFILGKISPDQTFAMEKFKEYNEKINNDECLEEKRRRLPDEEARVVIKKLIGPGDITRVKVLPKAQRKEVLQKVKNIRGVSQRQAARILGVSPNTINRS
ncbi:REP-associated tyrosine transposase [Neobacillus rhizophilus]|uniref:Transposase n=1 Tax=Neobacillus rhizophilus TaxID=2833579 RepID=A0A942U1K1_9BACI|nr:transposase [Neobacillus rhizophilus]